MKTVNMLGCHDGIPLLDLKGLLPEERIQGLIDTLVKRGGFVKDLHGAKNVYYQVNATYYSALGEDDRRMLLARAIQLFMPGKPQVWYLDLFAGKNDYAAMERAGAGGHKEINRTNLSKEDMARGLQQPLKAQLAEKAQGADQADGGIVGAVVHNLGHVGLGQEEGPGQEQTHQGEDHEITQRQEDAGVGRLVHHLLVFLAQRA